MATSVNSHNSYRPESIKLNNSEASPEGKFSQTSGKSATRSSEEEKKRNMNSAECYDCHEMIPHRLLYICHYPRCYGCYVAKDTAYNTPFHFYEIEKVFCSRCSFIGNHMKHEDYMEEAHPVATKLSSENKELEFTFRKLAYLDSEDVVDNMITSEFKMQKLPVLAVSTYLLNAEDTKEWESRKKMIDEFKETVEKCRADGADFAREQAVKALKCYNEFVKTVNEIIDEDDVRTEKKKNQNKRRESRRSSSSRDVKQEEIRIPKENMNLNRMKQEDPVTPTATVTSTSIPVTKEADEITVRMLFRNLNLHYDQIRDDMRLEHALHIVSEKLQEYSGSIENKKAAAKLFQQKYGVDLYYRP